MSGKLAGVRVGFDVEVHAADEAGVELTVHGPIGFDVRYDLTPAGAGSELTAFGSLRRSGGITGRVLSKATAALLSAGALEGVIGEIGPDILAVQEVGDPEALEALRERLAGD